MFIVLALLCAGRGRRQDVVSIRRRSLLLLLLNLSSWVGCASSDGRPLGTSSSTYHWFPLSADGVAFGTGLQGMFFFWQFKIASRGIKGLSYGK